MPIKTSLGPADDDWNRHLDNKFHDRRTTKPAFGYEKPGSRWVDWSKTDKTGSQKPKDQFKNR